MNRKQQFSWSLVDKVSYQSTSTFCFYFRSSSQKFERCNNHRFYSSIQVVLILFFHKQQNAFWKRELSLRNVWTSCLASLQMQNSLKTVLKCSIKLLIPMSKLCNLNDVLPIEKAQPIVIWFETFIVNCNCAN